MLKKIILVLFLISGLYFSQAANALKIRYTLPNGEEYIFDTEKVEFTKLKTVKSCVDGRYHDDEELMKKIQKMFASTVPQNEYFLSQPQVFIENGEEVERSFGVMFPSAKAIEFPFLTFVSGLDNPIVLEMAGGIGYVGRKVPLAFKDGCGTFYFNDLSKKMVEKFRKDFEGLYGDRLEQKQLIKTLKTIQGDCLSILDRYPFLEGTVNAVFEGNLEHFLNMDEHQKFLKIISRLLATRGRAFLCSESIKFALNGDTKIFYDLYFKRQEADELYPLFMDFIHRYNRLEDYRVIPEGRRVLEVKTPKHNARAGFKQKVIGKIKNPNKETCNTYEMVEVVEEHAVKNYFTDYIYDRLIAADPSLNLRIIDSFYFNAKGERSERWGKKGATQFAVILEKKASLLPCQEEGEREDICNAGIKEKEVQVKGKKQGGNFVVRVKRKNHNDEDIGFDDDPFGVLGDPRLYTSSSCTLL